MTYDALVSSWAARGRRYAVRTIEGVPHQVSDAEMRAIRAWRMAECRMLPVLAQAAAVLIVAAWDPPFAHRKVA